ncbi:MAG: hypothetical protein ACREOU_03275 [Candidatus Eiseniibacteriota bacterium]
MALDTYVVLANQYDNEAEARADYAGDRVDPRLGGVFRPGGLDLRA